MSGWFCRQAGAGFQAFRLAERVRGLEPSMRILRAAPPLVRNGSVSKPVRKVVVP